MCAEAKAGLGYLEEARSQSALKIAVTSGNEAIAWTLIKNGALDVADAPAHWTADGQAGGEGGSHGGVGSGSGEGGSGSQSRCASDAGGNDDLPAEKATLLHEAATLEQVSAGVVAVLVKCVRIPRGCLPVCL